MKKIETVHIVGMGALGVLFGSQIYHNVGREHVTFVMDPQSP